MSTALCMCCFHPKRPPSLVTRDLSICPWCINVFNQNKTSVRRLLAECRTKLHRQRGTAAIDRYIDGLEAQRTPSPARPPLPDDLCRDVALVRAKAEEGRLLGLYRTLVDGRKRRERARAIEQLLRDADEAAQRAAVDAHLRKERFIDAEIALHRSQLHRLDCLVEADVDEHFRAMNVPYPTVDVKVRLMRAYWRGLVNFDGRGCARPSAADAETLRAAVSRRDGGRCVLCAATAHLHLHHVVALQTCGSNRPANLATLCADCHEKQHTFAIGRVERGDGNDRRRQGSYQ